METQPRDQKINKNKNCNCKQCLTVSFGFFRSFFLSARKNVVKSRCCSQIWVSQVVFGNFVNLFLSTVEGTSYGETETEKVFRKYRVQNPWVPNNFGNFTPSWFIRSYRVYCHVVLVQFQARANFRKWHTASPKNVAHFKSDPKQSPCYVLHFLIHFETVVQI